MAQTEMSYATQESETLRTWIDNSKLAAASGHSPSMSVKDLEAAWAPRFDADEIDALVIPRRTMARRKAAQAQLSPEEQDRAFTLAQIQLEADRVFANPEKASRWLRTRNNRLSGQTPLSLLATAAGAAVVTEMLVQIDHGLYA
jgi:putative toxin-antitoxin system antitoxin component (TIGR02293 family)